MRKKAIWTVGVLTLSLLLAGCSQDKEGGTSGSAVSSAVADSSPTEAGQSSQAVDVTDTTFAELMEGIDVASCVTLGEYKGLSLTKEVQQVSDEDVQNAIKSAVETTLQEVNEAAAEGDTVNIDYVGKIDGEEFEGGKAEGFDLVLGSHSFIDGFEDGLIGCKAGEKKKLKLTFPANYKEDLSGKDVVFTVKVNAVKRAAKEISEEWVTANTDSASIADYERATRVMLEENNASTAEYNLQSLAWQTVVEGSTINQYPDKLVEFGSAVYANQLDSYCQYYNVSLDEYLSTVGSSREEYEQQKKSYGENMAAQILVMAALESAESLSNEDDEYKTLLEQYVTDSGMDQETFLSYYGAFNVEQTIMMKRISDLIIANATVSEKVAESGETAGSAAPEADSSAAGEAARSAAPEASDNTSGETAGSAVPETDKSEDSGGSQAAGSVTPETDENPAPEGE